MSQPWLGRNIYILSNKEGRNPVGTACVPFVWTVISLIFLISLKAICNFIFCFEMECLMSQPHRGEMPVAQQAGGQESSRDDMYAIVMSVINMTIVISLKAILNFIFRLEMESLMSQPRQGRNVYISAIKQGRSPGGTACMPFVWTVINVIFVISLKSICNFIFCLENRMIDDPAPTGAKCLYLGNQAG